MGPEGSRHYVPNHGPTDGGWLQKSRKSKNRVYFHLAEPICEQIKFRCSPEKKTKSTINRENEHSKLNVPGYFVSIHVHTQEPVCSKHVFTRKSERNP